MATTVDLANESSISRFYGKRAVWTDHDGNQHVGVLAADPCGGAWPVTVFEDGTHGRNGSLLDLVEDETEGASPRWGLGSALPARHLRTFFGVDVALVVAGAGQ